MAAPLVTDNLCELIKPRRPKGGRPPVDDRATLTGILFVLKPGIPRSMLPSELGCGSGVRCWRRLRDWQQAGVWDRLYQVLLSQLRAAERLDWSRAAADSASVRAVFWGKRPAQTRPTTAKRARSTTSLRMRRAFSFLRP